MSKRVCLSYSACDQAFVTRVAEDLREAGLDVCFDKWRIQVGDSIIDKINAGTEKCDFLVVVLSNSSIRRKWVQRELRSTKLKKLESRRTIILPALFEKTQIPTIIKDKRCTDFAANYQAGLTELLAAIDPEVTKRGIQETEEEPQDWVIQSEVPDDLHFLLAGKPTNAVTLALARQSLSGWRILPHLRQMIRHAAACKWRSPLFQPWAFCFVVAGLRGSKARKASLGLLYDVLNDDEKPDLVTRLILTGIREIDRNADHVLLQMVENIGAIGLVQHFKMKDHALRILGDTFTEHDVRKLSALLTDMDSGICENAAVLLMNLGKRDPLITESALEVLNRPEQTLSNRYSACNVLAKLDPDVLLSRYRDEALAGPEKARCDALRSIRGNSPGTLQFLFEVLDAKDSPVQVQCAALSSLLASVDEPSSIATRFLLKDPTGPLGQEVLKSVDDLPADDELARVLYQVVMKNEDFRISAEVVRFFIKRGDSDGLRVIAKAIRQGHKHTSYVAYDGLANFPMTDEVVEMIRCGLDDDDPDIVGAAAEAAGHTGDTRLGPELLRAANGLLSWTAEISNEFDDDMWNEDINNAINTLGSCCLAMGRIGYEEGAFFIEDTMHDVPSWELSSQCFEALACLQLGADCDILS